MYKKVSGPLNGHNYVSFVRVVQSEGMHTHKLYLVVLVNVGGDQMTAKLWDKVMSFLKVPCPWINLDM